MLKRCFPNYTHRAPRAIGAEGKGAPIHLGDLGLKKGSFPEGGTYPLSCETQAVTRARSCLCHIPWCFQSISVCAVWTAKMPEHTFCHRAVPRGCVPQDPLPRQRLPTVSCEVYQGSYKIWFRICRKISFTSYTVMRNQHAPPCCLINSALLRFIGRKQYQLN